MPKTKPQPQPQPQLNRRQLSHREQEQRSARRIVIGAVAVLAVIVLVLAWGLIDLYVLSPRQPVATVAGVPIRLDTYQKLVQYRRADYRGYISNLQQQSLQYAAAGDDGAFMVQIIDQQIAYAESLVSNAPYTVIDEVIEDEIARQECAARGLVVTADEVELELERTFGYERNTPTPSPTPSPTPLTATEPITITPEPTIAPMTYDEFVNTTRDSFSAMRKATGFGEQDFRRLLESSLCHQKLAASIGETVPLTAEQVHAKQILVTMQEEADAALARLNAGEDWDALAAELSQDYATNETGGDLGWFPKGQKGDAIDAAVFVEGLDPTDTLVVQDDSGFHLLRVLERDPARYLTESDLDAAKQQAVADWFAARRAMDDVVTLWDSSMIPEDTTQSTLY